VKKKVIYILLSVVILTFVSYTYLPHVLSKYYTIKSFKELNLEVKRLEYGDDFFEYAEGGKGETLVFIHGFQSSKSYWLPYCKKFVNDYRIILLDLPSHGNSSAPKNQTYDIQSLAKTFEIFVKKKKIDNFHLIGTSMGGGVASIYTYNNQNSVKSLLLLNPLGIDQEKNSELQDMLVEGKNLFFPNDLDEFDEMAIYVTGKPLSLSSYFKKYVLTQMVKKYTFFKRAFNELLTKTVSIDDLLPKIKTRTLILIGQKDRIINPASYEYFIDLMPNVKSIRFENGAHVFVDKCFDRAVNEMDAFLKNN